MLANDRDGDPAHPEKHPQRYVKISCGACQHCVFDKAHGCCLCGGPFNEKLERDLGAVRIL